MEKVRIKDLERARQVHEEIMAIDKEINELKKLASEAANDNCSLEFTVKVENYTKAPDEKKNIFDEDNSLLPRYAQFFYDAAIGSGFKSIAPQTDKYGFSFTDTDCLKVLAVILKIKCDRRRVLVRQMNKFGFEL